MIQQVSRRVATGALCGAAASLLVRGQTPSNQERVIGLYPTYPARGALQGLVPERQAEKLVSMGVNLGGGIFEDDEAPAALRRAGIQTFGLVVLFQGKKYWEERPESRPVMADGQPLFQDRWYAGLCPNQPWLRQEKLSEIEAMLRGGRYDVINLDFIRYPVHWERPEPKIPDTCYCDVCVREFSAAVNADIPAVSRERRPEEARRAAEVIRSRHDEQWRRWRASRITGFCREVAELRDRLRPETLISLAAVPWQPEDYDNAIHRIVAQDFRALAGPVDVFQPMSYYVLNNRPVEWIGEVNRYLVRETGKPLWPFVIFNPEHALDAEGWRQTFEQALSGGASGLVGFPFERMEASGALEPFREKFAAEA